jgi:hypothetical protein
MNIFTTLCISLENAKIETANKIFVLFRNDNQPIAYITFNNKNEICEIDKYHNILNINSLIGFNVKFNIDKSEELSPESFIQQVYVHSANYTYKYNSGVERVSSIIPIVTNVFDISEWNNIFTEKFDSSWSNVCKFVYYNKYQLKYGIKNRTFRQDDKRCVPTKDGILLSLSDYQSKFDMNKSCTICGFPITWIIINWMKVNNIRSNKDIDNYYSKKLFERLYNMEKYNKFIVYALEDDDNGIMKAYIVFKSYVTNSQHKRLDNDHIKNLLVNPNLWFIHRSRYIFQRVPLLTNKDTE